MTQPVGPGIALDSSRTSGIQLGTLEESRGGANPFAPPAAAPAPGAAPDGGIDFEAIQARDAESAALGDTDPEQAELEARHGQGETFANQFARGALSALLSPGALGGLQVETFGKLLGSKTIEDFGRDFGRAATGRSALEAAHALGAIFSGEEDVTGIADQARIAVDEQEKAWPLLSTAAQAAGAVGVGLATGGPSTGGLKGLAALAAAEGAGAGAQVSYDVDAPLTEVWTSALIGGTVGAALPAAVGGAGKAVSKVRGGKLADVFGGEGSFLSQAAEERAGKAVGMRGPEFRRLGVERARQVGKDVLDAHLDDGTPVLPNNPLQAARMDQGELTERLATALDQNAQKLGAIRQRASATIDEVMPEFRPRPADIAARVQREVVEPMSKTASPGARAQAAEVTDYITNLAERESLSLEDLFQERLALDQNDLKWNAKAPDAMRTVRGILEDEIENRVAVAAERGGFTNDYQELKRMHGSLKEATAASAKASGAELGNRWMSLSDNMVGVATIAGDLASGGGLSVLKGVAAGVGHKFIRERGSIMSASLLRRFTRTPAAVDVAVAGGREAQDAMQDIVRARNYIAQKADDAGANPSMRAVAENTAQHEAAEILAKRAGTFDPATWGQARSAPSPLARVLYRPQILDAVSNDLAATVPKSVGMRPSLDFDIDPAKLARLTKGADGPEAIGLVQAKVREIADALPPGEQAVKAYEAVLQRLDTADVAGALAEGHNVARGLMQAGQTADARSLALTLGDDAFGPAGRAYRDLLAAPDDVLKEMADPAKVRGALQQLELRGTLTKQIADEHRATLAAYQARQKLTGEPIPDGLKKQMSEIESLWSKGEEHVTLDGTRLGRIVEALDNMTESRVGAKVPKVSPQEQVAVTIKEALKHVEPTLKPRRGGRPALRRAAAAGAIAGGAQLKLNQAERLAQYEERLDHLSQAVVAPDTEERTAAISAAPPEVRVALVQAQDQKLRTLMRDMPKPRTDIHGTAMDSMSSEELRLGNAMWEATMEPLSVFQDFARGDLDPDKVAYAWKQYPGLQRMAQLGVLDVLQSQLDPEERSALPDGVLTQLDYMLGFNGGLQSTIEFSFSQRMTGIGEQIKQANGATPSPPSRGLQLPTSRPSLTERLAGAK